MVRWRGLRPNAQHVLLAERWKCRWCDFLGDCTTTPLPIDEVKAVLDRRKREEEEEKRKEEEKKEEEKKEEGEEREEEKEKKKLRGGEELKDDGISMGYVGESGVEDREKEKEKQTGEKVKNEEEGEKREDSNDEYRKEDCNLSSIQICNDEVLTKDQVLTKDEVFTKDDQFNIQSNRVQSKPIRVSKLPRSGRELSSNHTTQKFIHHVPTSIKYDPDVSRSSISLELPITRIPIKENWDTKNSSWDTKIDWNSEVSSIDLGQPDYPSLGHLSTRREILGKTDRDDKEMIKKRERVKRRSPGGGESSKLSSLQMQTHFNAFHITLCLDVLLFCNL